MAACAKVFVLRARLFGSAKLFFFRARAAPASERWRAHVRPHRLRGTIPRHACAPPRSWYYVTRCLRRRGNLALSLSENSVRVWASDAQRFRACLPLPVTTPKLRSFRDASVTISSVRCRKRDRGFYLFASRSVFPCVCFARCFPLSSL